MASKSIKQKRNRFRLFILRSHKCLIMSSEVCMWSFNAVHINTARGETQIERHGDVKNKPYRSYEPFNSNMVNIFPHNKYIPTR